MAPYYRNGNRWNSSSWAAYKLRRYERIYRTIVRCFLLFWFAVVTLMLFRIDAVVNDLQERLGTSARPSVERFHRTF